jgi:acetolactate synthase small subunit
MKYNITVITENKPVVLYRIAGLFLRRRLNVESLTVKETTAPQYLLLFLIRLECDNEDISKILGQIN